MTENLEGTPGHRPSFLDRFPALARLDPRRHSKRVPYVQQTSSADCGAACLAMVLRYHGKWVRLEEIREASGAGRDGTNALSLVDAAREFGLIGRGLSLDLDSVGHLDAGTILYWKFNHFVVLESFRKDRIEIVDPAFGRRRVTQEEFSRSFTGVALTFERAADFRPAAPGGHRTWSYVRHVLRHSRLVGRIIVTSVLLQLFGLALPLLTGSLVDRVLPRSDLDLLRVLAAGFGIAVLFHFLTTWIRSLLLVNLRTQVDARMTMNFVDHLMDLPFRFFQRRTTGDLIMRMNSNASVRETITSTAVSGALDGLLVVTYLIVIFWVSPPFGLLAVGLGLLRSVVYFGSRRRTQELMSETLKKQAETQNYQVQMLAGIETLKAAGMEPRAVERWSNLFVDVLNVNLARGRFSGLVQSLLSSLAFASPLLILLIGGGLVVEGRLTLGTMLALTALSAGFLGPLSTLVSMAIQLQELGGYIERLDDVLQTPREQSGRTVVRAPRLKGAIRLDGVSFSYGPMSAPAVSDVSLEIRPGQMVAVVGPSAAGKSTLAALLMGLHEPTAGRILYDGRDLASLERRSLRSQIGIVTQSAYLFGSSIRDNITLANPDVPLDDVMEAARLASVHDEIAAMPMGYNTVILDGGLSLSGGQRQRIVLARALVGKPAVLILDEATSSLDAVAERNIQEALETLQCTRIVIAHRLSTIVGADWIVVLREGRVVEQGRHADLILQDGMYRSLLARQIVV